MIVEDSTELVNLYERFLMLKGFVVSIKSENGQCAVDEYSTITNYPDLIIMDYRMPIKDGLTASKEILEKNPQQKILMISADHRIQESLSELRSIRFLKKPFDLKELLDVVVSSTS